MAEPTRTPITIEALVALGGTIEDKVNVRFGKEIAYKGGKGWHIQYTQCVTVEEFALFLKHFGAGFGFRRIET